MEEINYGRIRESDSFEEKQKGRLSGLNRFGESRIRHDSYQDDQFKDNYDPTYEDESGRRHPYEHGGKMNRWSDDLRSESSHENHTGKGPKGYQRSPERILEEANDILYQASKLDASEIEVNFSDSTMFLTGKVTDRAAKRLAERLIENIPGVEDVMNQLTIRRSVDGYISGIATTNE